MLVGDLALLSDIYAAYVSTVVRNVIGTYMKAEDMEEVVMHWISIIFIGLASNIDNIGITRRGAPT
jgi:predicted component of type VI protein secretion system